MIIRKKYQLSIYLFLFTAITCIAQTENYNQLWDEFIFTRKLSEKWSLESDVGFRTSSVPEDSNPIYSITQVYLRVWGHYRVAERWKLSFSYGYFYNSVVPELNQTQSNEYRGAIQATYFIARNRHKLNGRLRLEDRHLQNDEGNFEAVLRIRTQLKYLYPITAPQIEHGVLYTFASDELFFKSSSSVSGSDFFDRNRAIAGLGYAFTNNMQMEVSYVNEILPRDGVTKIYNVVQVQVIFTDFLDNAKKLFKKPKPIMDESY